MSMPTDIDDPRFAATIALLKRTGADSFQIRYSGKPSEGAGPPEYDEDDPVPLIWIAIADYTGENSSAAIDGWAVKAAATPVMATVLLAGEILETSRCVHCKRETRIDHEWRADPGRSAQFCWYVYDPELNTYRRSCEGVARVGRNDLCPCGSGKKFKKCHGISKSGQEHT